MTESAEIPAESKGLSQNLHSMQCMEVWGGNVAVESGISLHGIDAWISSQPYHGERTGGDIHYVSMCGRGRIARFVLADVAGHGEAVEDLAVLLQRLMRRHVTKVDQAQFARSMNRAFGRLGRHGVFATAALLTYFAPTDQLITCLAGHPRPLWYHASNREWTLLSHEGAVSGASSVGLPLGIVHSTDYQQVAVTLDKDDVIVLYTDALIETGGSDARSIGEQGLLECARRIGGEDPAGFASELVAAVDYMFGRRAGERTDDLTALVLHHNAADPPAMPFTHKLRMMGKMLGV